MSDPNILLPSIEGYTSFLLYATVDSMPGGPPEIGPVSVDGGAKGRSK